MLCIFGSCTARSNQQCLTAVPNRKSCRWMQVLLVNGLPALQFWECVMQTLNLHRSSVQREAEARCHCTHLQRSLFFENIDHGLATILRLSSTNTTYLLEDTAAVIEMIMKGLSPSWRHGTRTHGVDLDWLFERTNLHHSVIFVKMRTNDHLADFVHQGSFSSQHWKRQLLLCEIHTSVHSAAVSQRQYLRKMFDPWRAQTTIFQR